MMSLLKVIYYRSKRLSSQQNSYAVIICLFKGNFDFLNEMTSILFEWYIIGNGRLKESGGPMSKHYFDPRLKILL